MFKGMNVPAEKKRGKTGGDFKAIQRTSFGIGTKTVGVFVGQPVASYKHWEGVYPNRSYLGLCTGENCVYCQEGNTPTFSMQINFLTLVDGKPTMTLVEGPASLARALSEKEEIKGEDFFDNKVVLINRTDKTAFMIDDIKPPKEFENLDKLLKDNETYDIEGILKALVNRQTKSTEIVTNAPY